MPIFTYQAKTRDGQLVTDKIEADNIKIVSNKLQQLGYFPVSITCEKTDSEVSIFKRLKNKVERIKNTDIAVFNRQLADLLKGGMTLVKSLTLLINQTENPLLKETIEKLRDDVKEGSSFSDALLKHTRVFSNLYIGMVKAGETGGMIEEVMGRLAEFSEKEEEIRGKIKSALIYPLTMIFVGLLSVFFLMTFVIPKFVIMFADIGQALPLPTIILISTSQFLKNYWWGYIPAFILFVVFINQYAKSKKGRLVYDSIKLRLPVLGEIIRKQTISRFTRTLGVLLANGILIIPALEIVKQTLNNQLFSQAIDNIYDSVKEGKGIINPIKENKLFPPMVADMLAIGDEAGNIESSLFWVADVYSREVENRLKAATSLIEPIIILIMGLVVGFIVLAMLLPVFSISVLIK